MICTRKVNIDEKIHMKTFIKLGAICLSNMINNVIDSSQFAMYLANTSQFGFSIINIPCFC